MHACGNQSGRKDCRTPRRWREVPRTLRYWRSFWSAPVFSGAFLLEVLRRNARLRQPKRQKRLPHSTTLARGSTHPSILAKLLECACLFWRFFARSAEAECTLAATKAAEKTAALHDAGARFHAPFDTGEAFGVRLSFLALFCSKCSGGRHACGNQSGRKDCR